MINQEVSHKITHAFERISKTFRVLLWEESKKYQLSPIQIQILIFCLTHKEELAKVSLLAKEFDLTKATVSDSIRVLLTKNLLIKVPDSYDSRSYTLRLTGKGKQIAQETSSYTQVLHSAVEKLPESDRGVFLHHLLTVIDQLNKKAIISVQRMCLTCSHFRQNNQQNYCSFLNKELQNEELQIDCPEHTL